MITILKTKKGIATVILMDGKRYVYEPEGKRKVIPHSKVDRLRHI